MDSLAELPREAYEKARPLFAPLTYNLAMKSILSGFSPGPIFVDNTTAPRVALARTQSRVLLGGQADDAFVPALKQLVLTRYYSQAASSEWEGYTLHYAPVWEASIAKILDGKYPMCTVRHLLPGCIRLDPRFALAYWIRVAACR